MIQIFFLPMIDDRAIKCLPSEQLKVTSNQNNLLTGKKRDCLATDVEKLVNLALESHIFKY